MKKVCPKCGTESDSNFCPNCGTELTSYEDKESSVIEVSEHEDKHLVAENVVVENENKNNTQQEPNEEVQEVGGDGGNEPNVSEITDTADQKADDNVDSSDNSQTVTANEVTEASEVEVAQAGKTEPKNDKKKKVIIGSAIAGIALLIIAIISSQPKLVSIEASYDGPTTKGTVINNSSDITVTGTYDDETTKPITGWNVKETTIVPGFNDIDVTYDDQKTSFSVYSPLMSEGKYIASVDEIKDVLYYYNSKHVDGFTGFTEDDEIDGVYKYDGTNLPSNVSFTKRAGGENKDVSGDEIPNAVIVTVLLKFDDFGDDLEDILSTGASAYTAVDPDIEYEDAYSQIKQITGDAVKEADGNIGTATKKCDNETVSVGLYVVNDNLLIFYSFQSY